MPCKRVTGSGSCSTNNTCLRKTECNGPPSVGKVEGDKGAPTCWAAAGWRSRQCIARRAAPDLAAGCSEQKQGTAARRQELLSRGQAAKLSSKPAQSGPHPVSHSGPAGASAHTYQRTTVCTEMQDMLCCAASHPTRPCPHRLDPTSLPGGDARFRPPPGHRLPRWRATWVRGGCCRQGRACRSV